MVSLCINTTRTTIQAISKLFYRLLFVLPVLAIALSLILLPAKSKADELIPLFLDLSLGGDLVSDPDYGQVSVGSSRTLTITLFIGGALFSPANMTGSPDFTLVGTTCVGDQPIISTSCTITVKFQPSSAGLRQASFVLPFCGYSFFLENGQFVPHGCTNGTFTEIYTGTGKATTTQPPPPPPTPQIPVPTVTNACLQSGSIISVDNQSVGEIVPVVGVPHRLMYFSDRVPGRSDNNTIHLPLVGSSTTGINQVLVDIKYAGREFTQTFQAQSNLSYDFVWDGKDVNGNRVQGSVNAVVKLTNIGPGGSTSSTTNIKLGGWNVSSVGLGGWNFSNHHFYDNNTHRIYFGSGSSASVEGIPYQGSFLVPNQGGTEAYIFDSNGNHIQTKNALTGDLKYAFNYDGQGRLLSVTDSFGKQTSIYYLGQIASQIISPFGQITDLGIDSNGWLASVQNPNNETFQMTYQANGLLSTFRKPAGQITALTYDSHGFLLKDLGAGGNFLSLLRSSTNSGWQILQSTAEGRQTNYVVSSDGLNSTRTIVDSRGLPSNSINNPNGISSSQNPDGITSRINRVPDPRFGLAAPMVVSSSLGTADNSLNRTATTTKNIILTNPADVLGLQTLTSQTQLQNDPGRIFNFKYDGSTRTAVSTSPLGRNTVVTLNNQSQISTFRQGNLEPVYVTYDQLGRTSSVRQGTRETSLSYDSSGNVNKFKNSSGKISSLKYDLAGRILEETLPDGIHKIGYKYDSNGNLIGLTPSSKPQHQFSQNLMELIETYLPPSLGNNTSVSTSYSYNFDRQLTQIKIPDGQTIKFNYHSAAGQLLSINTPSGSFDYSYLPNSGQISEVKSPDGVKLNYSYQGPLLSGTTTTIGNLAARVSYAFNSDFSVQSMSILGADGQPSTISSTYDQEGRTASVGSEIFEYDNRNGLLALSKINSISEKLGFNKYGELESDSFELSGSKHKDRDDDDSEKNDNSFFSYSLKRDSAGRIVRKVEQFREREQRNLSYSYDDLGRVSEIKVNNRQMTHLEYDANGNRTKLIRSGREILGVYDSQDRLVKYGNVEFKYNSNGYIAEKIERSDDERSDGRNHAETRDRKKLSLFSYDVFGNLKSVTLPNEKKIEYIIDGQNRRVGKKVNGVLVQGFLYKSQTQIVAELDGSGKIVKQFIYGEKANVPDYMIYKNKEYRIISNQVGTPRLIVESSSGKIIEELEYDDFGVPEENEQKSILPFGFAGGLYDRDTNLVRFGARDYSPEIGRWLSKDPILFRAGTANLYSYVDNDPINLFDPSGLILNFADTGTRILYEKMYKTAPAWMQVFLGNLARDTETTVNIGFGSLPPKYNGLTSGNSTDIAITLSPSIDGQSPGFAESILAHELGHVEQLLGDMPVDPNTGLLPEDGGKYFEEQYLSNYNNGLGICQ